MAQLVTWRMSTFRYLAQRGAVVYHGSRPRSVIAPVLSARLALTDSAKFSGSGESLTSSEDSSLGLVYLARNKREKGKQARLLQAVVHHKLRYSLWSWSVFWAATMKSLEWTYEKRPRKWSVESWAQWYCRCLFRCLHYELGKIVHPNSHIPDIGDSNTVFVDQVVSITQRILDGSLGNLVHVNIDELILALVR